MKRSLTRFPSEAYKKLIPKHKFLQSKQRFPNPTWYFVLLGPKLLLTKSTVRERGREATRGEWASRYCVPSWSQSQARLPWPSCSWGQETEARLITAPTPTLQVASSTLRSSPSGFWTPKASLVGREGEAQREASAVTSTMATKASFLRTLNPKHPHDSPPPRPARLPPPAEDIPEVLAAQYSRGSHFPQSPKKRGVGRQGGDSAVGRASLEAHPEIPWVGGRGLRLSA